MVSQIFFVELPVPPQEAGVIGTLNVYIFKIIILVFGAIRYNFDLKNVILFLSFFVCVNVCVYFHYFCKYTMHICYVFNVIDGFY